MYTKDNIRDIFYTGSHAFRADEQLVVDVLFLIEENLVQLKHQKISDLSSYHGYISDIQNGVIPVIDIEGGQVGHMALKLLGREYLISRGFRNVKFEKSFEGYVLDVSTEDASFIVECGNTNPEKIFKYFKNKKVKEVVIVPYPNQEEKYINAYIFQPTKELSDFLFYKEEKYLENVKNIVNKKKK